MNYNFYIVLNLGENIGPDLATPEISHKRGSDRIEPEPVFTGYKSQPTKEGRLHWQFRSSQRAKDEILSYLFDRSRFN
jgi:hypothetical protein